jgi:hypothetical protein
MNQNLRENLQAPSKTAIYGGFLLLPTLYGKKLSTRHSPTTRKPRQAAKAPFLERVASHSTPPHQLEDRLVVPGPRPMSGMALVLGGTDPGGPQGQGRPQALTAQADGQGANVSWPAFQLAPWTARKSTRPAP